MIRALSAGNRRLVLPVVAALVGGVVWIVAGHGGERSIEDTVLAFFEARREGDCERLVELAAEGSRPEGRGPEGGRPGRDELVDRCAEVVDHHRPALAEVEVVGDRGDEAVVSVAVAATPSLPGRQEGMWVGTDDEGGRSHDIGHLVRQGGEWRVEIDHAAFRLGRSVEETVRAYVNAYNDGDCERLVELVSERLSGGGGERPGDPLEQCRAAAEARLDLPDPAAVVVEPAAIDVSPDRGDPRAATATWSVTTRDGPATETVALVQEGLAWRLDSLPAAVEQIEVASLVELDVPLPDHRLLGLQGVAPATGVPGFVELDEGSDVAERRAEAGFAHGATATFGVGDGADLRNLTVVLYEFEDQAGARAYADLLAHRVGQQAEPRASVTGPSVGDARGGVVYCGSVDDDCRRAHAAAGVATTGRFVVAVEVVNRRGPAVDELVGHVEEVLRAQLRAL